MISLKDLPKHEQERAVKDAGLGIFIKDEHALYNPLLTLPKEFENTPELYYMWLLSKPEYFWLTCKEILNVDLAPFQQVILEQLWNHKFPLIVAARGASKSFSLAVYALLRLLFLENRKIIICGSAFRQSQIIMEYMVSIIKNSKILRNLIPDSNFKRDPAMWRLEFGRSYALAVPIGHSGETIRGLRANDIIADEFASQNQEVFETVIAGFASVSSAPSEKADKTAKLKLAKLLNVEMEDDTELDVGNQIIIAGTASYAFNHFSHYHDRYRKIIKSRGQKKKLIELGLEKDFNWKDYCVIRLPVELLPPGFMDEDQVQRQRATIHSATFDNEYRAVFSKDSDGFFKRSLIESCVPRPGTDIVRPDGEILKYADVAFDPKLSGDSKKTYVMGIDPAMMSDNFAIVIVEINQGYRSVVYCWTTNKADHREKLKLGLVNENAYFSYCARKVRNLMSRFQISRIAIDMAGGGLALCEALNDKNLLSVADTPLWPIVTDKVADTDFYEGLHIIDPINFSKEAFTDGSNEGLRKDMEDKRILFPYFDGITLEEFDKKSATTDAEDTYIICIKEIEELKDELSTIIMTQTPNGRARYDTPEIKLVNGKKGRMKKDRYSALLMANKAARDMINEINYQITTTDGGFTKVYRGQVEDSHSKWVGPPTVVAKLDTLYDNIYQNIYFEG